eukprot:gene12466-15672_t
MDNQSGRGLLPALSQRPTPDRALTLPRPLNEDTTEEDEEDSEEMEGEETTEEDEDESEEGEDESEEDKIEDKSEDTDEEDDSNRRRSLASVRRLHQKNFHQRRAARASGRHCSSGPSSKNL